MITGPESVQKRDLAYEENQLLLFEQRIQAPNFLPQLDQSDIRTTYLIAQDAFAKKRRKTSERFFEHLRETALILINGFQETKFSDTDIIRKTIQGALLHDVIEDTDYFSIHTIPPNLRPTTEERMGDAYVGLVQFFGDDIANWVDNISEPLDDNLTNEQVTANYHIRLLALEETGELDPESLLIKMADRIHNHRTPYDKEKQKRKVAETRHFYKPLFKRVLGGDYRYRAMFEYLSRELEIAMQTTI